MGRVSYTNESVETPAEGVTVECQTTVAEDAQSAPASEIPNRPANHSAVATREVSEHAIFDDNNIGFEDIILPRINLVQKVGELSTIFNEGELVLDQKLVIHQPTSKGKAGDKPLTIVIIGFKKTVFVEKVEGGGMGMVCRTREDVVRAGGTLDYKEWKESVKAVAEKQPGAKALRRFDYMTTALILIEKPENIKDENQAIFPYEVDGKFYCMAFWTLKSTGYTHGAKRIFTFRKTRSISDPSVKYSSNTFTLTSKLENFFGNYSWVPVVEPGPKTSEAMRKLVNTIKGVE